MKSLMNKECLVDTCDSMEFLYSQGTFSEVNVYCYCFLCGVVADLFIICVLLSIDVGQDDAASSISLVYLLMGVLFLLL